MTLFDEVYQILISKTSNSYGVETFVSIDQLRQAIIVTRMVGAGIHTHASVEAIVRVRDGMIILEYDDTIEYQRLLHKNYPDERNVLHDLLSAGIPRSQIMVAYRNEGVRA